MKPAWLTELERGMTALMDEVKRRREVTPVDAVADGIVYSLKEFKERIRVVTAPGRELTPAEWASEQDPPVTEQAARKWIHLGELEARQGPRGWLIQAGAKRIKRSMKVAANAAP